LEVVVKEITHFNGKQLKITSLSKWNIYLFIPKPLNYIAKIVKTDPHIVKMTLTSTSERKKPKQFSKIVGHGKRLKLKIKDV